MVLYPVRKELIGDLCNGEGRQKELSNGMMSMHLLIEQYEML